MKNKALTIDIHAIKKTMFEMEMKMVIKMRKYSIIPKKPCIMIAYQKLGIFSSCEF